MRDPSKGAGIVDRNGSQWWFAQPRMRSYRCGAAFAGTTDDVAAQIKRFHRDVAASAT